MSYDINYLYDLLPAYHRERDAKLAEKELSAEEKSIIQQLEIKISGYTNPEDPEAKRLQKLLDEARRGPLKAILSLFAEQLQMLEENVEQLYDDQFIETCSDWAVPYIGDLVGTRGLLNIPDMPFSQRAQVANTIAYRRRKGTAAVIEQLARDVTGWPAKVVEYFQLLSTTQYMNHTRLQSPATTSIKSNNKLVHLNTAFDPITRTADIRGIGKNKGKYNLPNLGVFVWKNTSYPITKGTPFGLDDRRFFFNPLGIDTPLNKFNQSEDDISDLASLDNVPHQIKRRFLYNSPEHYYGNEKSLVVYVDDSQVDVPSSKTFNDIFVVTNLGNELDAGGNVIGWKNLPKNKIAIDPELGRLAFPSSKPAPKNVTVSYYYAALSDIGSGEYDRWDSFTGQGKKVFVPEDFPSVQDAINSIKTIGGIVEIQDSATYSETVGISISAGKKIELRAANKQRPVLKLDGPLKVFGGTNSELHINGLCIVGDSLQIIKKNTSNKANSLALLNLIHSSLRSEFGALVSEPPLPALLNECSKTKLSMKNTFCGGIRALDSTRFKAENCVIDSGAPTNNAIAAISKGESASSLEFENVTVIGKVHTRSISAASNCIFYGKLAKADTLESPLICERLQKGCVRYSYLPEKAKVPQPYKCVAPNSVEAYSLEPVFSSTQFGNTGYAQLSQKCPSQITQGSEDGSEIGVNREMYVNQRIEHLKNKLNEYLHFGLEAGVFVV